MGRLFAFLAVFIPVLLTAQAPNVPAGSALNGASFTVPITPGSFAALFGSNLAPPGTSANASGQASWPTSLGGTSMRLNGIAVPLAFVSPGQVNFQVPWELAGLTQATLTLTTAAGTSFPVSVGLGINPGIFTSSGSEGIFLHSNNLGVDASRPALQGEVLRMFCVGLGPVSNQPATGSQPSSSNTTTLPIVTIGGIAAQVQASQLNTSNTLGVFIGTYQVTVQVPANVTPGSSVSVVLNMGGAISNTVTLPVQAAPAPVISLLAPSTATAGGTGFTLTVNGSNFLSGSVVQWRGSPRTTTFVGSTQLTTAISAADIATAGTVPVTVSNAGIVSNTMNFVVNPAAAPTLRSLSPSSALTGGPAFTLQVNGAGFLSNSIVQWNGSPRTTTFVSAAQLTAAITAADIANSSTAQVTVTSPSAGTSSPLSFVVASGVITSTPVSLSFTAAEGANPASQQLQVSAVNGASFAASVSTTSGGAWLGVSPAAGIFPATLNVAVNSTTLTAGTYQGTVRIQSGGANASIPVTLTVTAPAVGLTVSPASLQAEALADAANVGSQSIVIGNTGGTSVSWTSSVSTLNGGSWLSVTPSSGSAALHAPSVGQVSFTAQGLPPGVYSGSITVNPGELVVAVRLVVSPAAPVLRISQSGLVLTGVAGGGTPPPQSVIVANTGTGTMNWTVAVVRGAGISVTPASGSSVAGAATLSTFTVQASTAGLAVGSYYGLIRVAATGAANSPQFLSVVFDVLPNTSAPTVRAFPQGVIFTAPAGGAPAPQTVSLATGSASTVGATVSATTQSGGNWLTVSPSSVSISPSGAVTINANTASLGAGVYTGTLTVVPSDGSPAQEVSAYLTVTSSSVAALLRGSAAVCVPGKLIMAMRLLGNNFSSPVGWPVNLEAQVIDDCGNPALGATVIASFSNGDAPLALVRLGNGIYSATWKPATSNAATVTVRATQAPLASATVTVSGRVGSNAAPPPSVGSGGVVNAASFASGAELAPGTIVSVFGSNLATSDGNLAGFPLPVTLAGIKLTIGGIDAPLFYAGTGQVNTQIPYELSAGSQSQVVARAIPASGAELDGVPEPITIGAARPGIFIATGTQGAILNVSNQVVDSANPATAGDVIVIFCTGLGAVTPAAQTGQPASSGVAVVQPTVTVGGVTAPLQYAGVAPGFVGLYQVNVAIPAGVTPGPTVPVVITQNGLPSNTATIAVR